MSTFLNEDFFLNTETAKVLYHDYAAKMPIIDYHCHISPKQIAEDTRFENLTQLMLGGDHYKWRVMRTNGVDEKYITGDAEPFEKFKAFATILPRAIGNPVHQWTHLELKRFFNCDLIINEENAEEIWNICNNKIVNDPNFSAKGIITSSNVTALATTDDPIDTLEWHRLIKQDKNFATKVLPAWRPDKAMRIAKPDYLEYMQTLATVSNTPIQNYDDIKAALINRIEYFHNHGCKASDHGIEGVYYAPATDEELNNIVKKRLANQELTKEEILKYEYNILAFLGKQYHKYGWVFEIHYGAGRDANRVMFEKLGPDTGYDYIRPQSGADGLANLLNELYEADSLPKTLLFSLNANDDAILNVLAGSFQKSGIRSAVQQGSAWWFNDTKLGMTNQIKNMSSNATLGNFVGMLTDSRSLLSYSRHEYFRRILCSILGDFVENGEYPNDIEYLGKLVQEISYENANNYFGY